VYALRDEAVSGLKDADNDGIVDSGTAADPLFAIGGDNVAPITQSDLFDVTSNPLQTKTDGTYADATASAAALGTTGTSSDCSATSPCIKSKSGWFLDLRENSTTADDNSTAQWKGEKGVSSPVILAGKLFFTTYIPELTQAQIDQCQLAEGGGRLYGLNVLTGAALFTDWNGAGDSTTPVAADRYKSVGAGIPSEVLPVFQKKGVTLLVGGGENPKNIDPKIPSTVIQTWWYEEPEGQ
jgi:type IV pilus assembly protein PilY1